MKITKDQIQQLVPEQQETLASIEIQHAKTRQRLVKQTGHYRGFLWLPPGIMFVLCLVPAFFTSQNYGPLSVIVLALSLWFLIQFHAAGVNRRLDALIELLEADKTEGN